MEEQRPSKPVVIGSNPLRCKYMVYRKIRWKYRYGYYKKKFKRNFKVYSLKVRILIKRRTKLRLKKRLNVKYKRRYILKYKFKKKVKKKFIRRAKLPKEKRQKFKKFVKLTKSFKKRIKLPKKIKFAKAKIGVVKVHAKRRNIFATLSTPTGRLLVTVTTGILNVKGKERQATHIIKATANLLIKKIRKIKITVITYIVQGNSTRRKKKLFYDTLRRVRRIRIKKIIVVAPRAHNGCRPSKNRRL